MVLPGETLALGASDVCGEKWVDCGETEPCQHVFKLQVLSSAAGFYIGTMCPRHGPNTRESGYYKTRELAQRALEKGGFERE